MMASSQFRHIQRLVPYAYRFAYKRSTQIAKHNNSYHKLPLACNIDVCNICRCYSLSSVESVSGEEPDIIRSSISDQDDGNEFGNLKMSLEKKKATEKKKELSKASKTVRAEKTSGKRKVSRPRQSDDNADKFGDLWKGNPMWYSEAPLEEKDFEPGDESRAEYPVEKQFKTAKAYLEQMKLLVNQKKLKEALELIPDMRKNCVFPIVSNYTFLIGACGRAGYTEMAFKLLRQMTDRGFRPTCAVLTGLFNACAECPFPEYGLKKAVFLRQKITEKNWLINRPGYHAMIKAFGKCGDIATAFEIVDEMIENGTGITEKTYSFLLMTCISDKDAGFTYAVEVWRKMLAKKLEPKIYSFNLLLRAIRDCGIGPDEISSLLLQHWSSYGKRPYGLNAGQSEKTDDILKLPNPEFSDAKLLESPKETGSQTEPGMQAEENTRPQDCREMVELQPRGDLPNSLDVKNFCPNILDKRPVGSQFVDLTNISTASDRLALVGNADGFLKLMQKYKVTPDIKTFMLLLESLPPSTEAEKELLSLLEMYKVHPDTDFFNILIKRRNVRHDFTAAKNVLLLLNKYNLSPDIVTFGVLALGCRNPKQGSFLLRDMKDLGITPNVEIMGALISSACKSVNLEYLIRLLKVMRSEAVQPNKRILEKIESMVEVARKNILRKEQGKLVDECCIGENFSKDFQSFCSFYEDWLHAMTVEVPEHPWEQYKADISLKPQLAEPCV